MSSIKWPVKILKTVNICVFKRYASSSKVRVRFAPSPTGDLHLGGLRTALYNYLLAKSKNGTFILRIEDTDQVRKLENATKNLIEDLKWCGIVFDEGPIYQSERLEIYQKYVKQLLEQKDAYYCFCSTVRLNLLRKEALKAGEVSKYDNKCRNLSDKEVEEKLRNEPPPCVRFKLHEIEGTHEDLVQGPSHYNSAIEGDPVILKQDGFPTYHLANVVDDHLMEISHALRGTEWLISTPKHLQMYKAFNWEPPQYAHLPLLLNPDGSKLSKRQGDLAVRSLREKGYSPNSIINFVIEFGGGFDIKKSEKHANLYTIEELVEKFDISKVKESSCKIDMEKLDDYNKLEILRLMKSEDGVEFLIKSTQEIVRSHFENSIEIKTKTEKSRVKHILEATTDRIKRLKDLVSKDFRFLWIEDSSYLPEDKEVQKGIEELCKEIKDLNEELNKENSAKLLKLVVSRLHLKNVNFMHNLRSILTGNKQGLPVNELMTLLGKKELEFRLANCLQRLTANNSTNQQV